MREPSALREAFVLVHATDMLAEFRRSCAAIVVAKAVADHPEEDFLEVTERAEEGLPALPSRGKLDLGDVLSSDYFFA
jgi:DNA-directed RNA polymerase